MKQFLIFAKAVCLLLAANKCISKITDAFYDVSEMFYLNNIKINFYLNAIIPEHY